jgi:hypothetical protein
MNKFLYDARISSSPGEGTGKTIERSPVLEDPVGDTWFNLGAVKCCDVANGVDL